MIWTRKSIDDGFVSSLQSQPLDLFYTSNSNNVVGTTGYKGVLLPIFLAHSSAVISLIVYFAILLRKVCASAIATRSYYQVPVATTNTFYACTHFVS